MEETMKYNMFAFSITFISIVIGSSSYSVDQKEARKIVPTKPSIERIAEDLIVGPEDSVIDDSGTIYTGLADGRIISMKRDGSGFRTIVNTQGRPLGIDIDQNRNLVVCDAPNGLLKIDMNGKITVLSKEQGGLPINYADDLDIAKNGKIYFTDASWKYSIKQTSKDYGQTNGRLLMYDPASGETTLLLDSLGFANGVALSPDNSFVLVNETWKQRVTRYWLKGEKKGQYDVFVEVEGNPDNINANKDGTYWLALFGKEIVKLDKQGKIIRKIETGMTYRAATNGREYEGKLYLGSINEKGIGIINLD